MAEENKYDQESIRELLTWAQNTLNNKTYPEGELVLDKCIKVIDCKSHIEAMIQMISKNWENPTFYPTMICSGSLEQNWKKYNAHFCIFAVSTMRLPKAEDTSSFDLSSFCVKRQLFRLPYFYDYFSYGFPELY